MEQSNLKVGDFVKIQPLDETDRILESAATMGFGYILSGGTIIDILTEEEAIEQNHVQRGGGSVAIVDWGNGDFTDSYYTLPEDDRGMVVNLSYLAKVESDA